MLVVLRVLKVIFRGLDQGWTVVLLFWFGGNLSDDFFSLRFLLEQIVDVGLGKSFSTGHEKFAHDCSVDPLIKVESYLALLMSFLFKEINS